MAMYLKSTWDAADMESNVPAGYKEEMREAIDAQIRRHARGIRFRWMAAAASLLIIATAVWLFIPGVKHPAAQAMAKADDQPETHTNWKEHANTSNKSYSLKLHDGSVVKLAPKAKIKYEEPFGHKGHRSVYMEGEADFDVAHNKSKPFTVYTKLFSTRALGTSFRVSESAAASKVKLYQGKVLIRSIAPKLKGWKKDIILKPGDEMKYIVEEGIVSVKGFNIFHTPDPVPADNTNSITDENIIAFDNAPLPDVMKKLSEKYHSTISYDEAELKGKFFTGELFQRDSLSVLLKVIANMNGLQVIKKNDGYIIAQSK